MPFRRADTNIGDIWFCSQVSPFAVCLYLETEMRHGFDHAASRKQQNTDGSNRPHSAVFMVFFSQNGFESIFFQGHSVGCTEA